MSDKMVACGSYMLCELAPEKSTGGILIPDSVKSRDNKRAVVTSKGPECVGEIKLGDVVLLPQVGFATIKVKSSTMFLIKERDVMARWTSDGSQDT